MKDRVPSRRLSAADAAFIYLERKEIPLAIASISIFDGPIPFDEFVATIESRLHLVPRYKQVVAVPPMNLGVPTWEDYPRFDIRRHIFRVTLNPPGDEAELEALASRILSQRLDRSKPLWEIHIVDGLKDGRGAMIFRVHHALADGIAGSRIVQVLLDSSPEGSPAIPEPRRPPPPRPDQPEADGISGAVHKGLKSWISAEKGLLGFVETLLGDEMQEGLKNLVGLLPEFAASVERLPFNKACSGDRKFCWADFDFAEVQAIREAVGGAVTVNDVILATLTRALARYVKLHGETVVNRFVRIVCPVNLRSGGPQEGLGNLISFLPVALPMEVRGPLQMLRAVAARTRTMKRGGAAHLVALAAGCIAAAPPALQALFWKGIAEISLPLPLLNMICTNVPGWPVPLYAAGRRMIAAYPQVPTGWDLGINVAVQSYDGKLFFGLIADAHVASDVGRLRDFLRLAFRELCRAAATAKRRVQKESEPQTTAGRTAKTVQSNAAELHPPRHVPPAAKLAAEAPAEMTPRRS